MTQAVSVNNLSKSFGKIQALKNINFEAGEGELFGFIGPDGAGKTTLFRILTTLLLPDKGEAKVGKFDVIRDYKKIRASVGYMPGRFSLYQDLTVEENLKFFATVFGTTIEENYDLIKDIYVLLEPFKKRKAGKLSGGMKQKLALSCALIHRPDILFLDEPTTGVDPVSRNEFWDMLAKLINEGITILVSTPYMDEASRCDRIALIQNGSLLKIDTLKGITAKYDKPLYAIRSENTGRLLYDIRSFEYSGTAYSFGDSVHYTDKRGDIDLPGLEKYIQDKGHAEVSISRISAGIEDCFMSLMGTGNE
jgi:ABC-type multidrug transport system ATPase subunit